jgi:hypothetical protein
MKQQDHPPSLSKHCLVCPPSNYRGRYPTHFWVERWTGVCGTQRRTRHCQHCPHAVGLCSGALWEVAARIGIQCHLKYQTMPSTSSIHHGYMTIIMWLVYSKATSSRLWGKQETSPSPDADHVPCMVSPMVMSSFTSASLSPLSTSLPSSSTAQQSARNVVRTGNRIHASKRRESPPHLNQAP